MRTEPVVLNSKGQPIVLNAKERYHAMWIQNQIKERFGNSLGSEISITTLTTIMKKITEQKFFEIPPADYLPVRVGEGAWSSNLVTYRSFSAADEFETGIIDLGGNNSRQAMSEAAVDALTIQVFNWGKQVAWNIPQLETAAKAGNWDLVTAKEESRKKNWDLGIQRVAFLGARGSNGSGGSCLGLLNQSGITTNTTVITKAVSTMTTGELKTFTAQIVEAYRSNNNRTAYPSHWIVPESDYNGMAATVSPDFPIKTILELLTDMFKVCCRNPNFKILPLAYGDAAYHSDVSALSGKQVYVLLNYDEKSIRMDIPVDYTNTLANSLDNFNFQNSAYGQFTGVLAYRPLELMYFVY